MIIKIKPVDSKYWGLYFDDKLIGRGKLLCDVYVAAYKFSQLFEQEIAIVVENLN